MAKLSPAAQAVMDAAEDDCIHPVDRHRIAAAALRAAAYQVAPVNSDGPWMWTDRDEMRSEILAIAAELVASHG